MKTSSIVLIFVGLIFLLLPFVFKEFVGQNFFAIVLLVYLLMLFGLVPALVILTIFPDTEINVSGAFKFLQGITWSAGGAFAAFFLGVCLFFVLNNSWYSSSINNQLEQFYGNTYVFRNLSMQVVLRNAKNEILNRSDIYDKLRTKQLEISYKPRTDEVCVESCDIDPEEKNIRSDKLVVRVPIALPDDVIQADKSNLVERIGIQGIDVRLAGFGSTGGLYFNRFKTEKIESTDDFNQTGENMKPQKQNCDPFGSPINNIIKVDANNNLTIDCLVEIREEPE